MDTEAVQTCVLLLTPVRQDVEFHGVRHLLCWILQGEHLRLFSTAVVHEASKKHLFFWLGLDALGVNQS